MDKIIASRVRSPLRPDHATSSAREEGLIRTHTIVMAGVTGSGKSRLLRDLAQGAAGNGKTVLVVGLGTPLNPTSQVYSVKQGERIAALRVDMVILDEVSTDFRTELAAAFARGAAGVILDRLGAMIGHGATLVITKTLAAKWQTRKA